MSRIHDLTRALTDSVEEYDETLRDKVKTAKGAQDDLAGHFTDINEDHQVTKDQVGLSKLENYPTATVDDIDLEPLPVKYVDVETSIAFIRRNTNLARLVNTQPPISPIGGVVLNTLRPKLKGGQYVHAYDLPRDERRFQITTDTTPWTETPILDVTLDADELVLPFDLENYTTYRWRYQDTAADGIKGAWQEATFETQFEIVLTPSISLPSEADLLQTSLDPLFQGSPFEVNQGTDTHVASEWTVYDRQGNVVQSETVTTGDLTQWTPSPRLPHASELRVELVYLASSYSPSGVAELAFETTAGDTLPPTVTLPTEPTEAFTATVTWTGTDPQDLDDHATTRLQVARDAGFTDLVLDTGWSSTAQTEFLVDSVRDLTTYYVRAKVGGSVLLESGWSNTASVTTGVMVGLGIEVQVPEGVILNDGSDYALGGAVGTTPTRPAVFFRDSTGAIYDQSIFTDMSGDAEVIAVETFENGTLALIRDVTNDTHRLCRYDDQNALLWCTSVDDLTPEAMVCSDVIYLIGSTEITVDQAFFGQTGRVCALDATGAALWSTVIGGNNADVLYGGTLTDSGLIVVGKQSSDLGAVTAPYAGLVATLDTDGGVVDQRSYGHVDGAEFYDVVALSETVRVVVGQVSDEPAYFITTTVGEVVSHRTLPRTLGRRLAITEFDTGSFLLAVEGVDRTTLARIHTNHLVEWVFDVSSSRPSVSVYPTPEGLEFTGSFLSASNNSGVVLRIPSTGVLSDLPYSLDFSVSATTLALGTNSGTPIQDIGEWSPWITVKNVSTRITSSSVAPTTTSFMPVDTQTERYQTPQWVSGGSYESYSSWKKDRPGYHSKSSQTITGGVGLFPFDGYTQHTVRSPSIAHISRFWPSDTDTVKWTYDYEVRNETPWIKNTYYPYVKKRSDDKGYTEFDAHMILDYKYLNNDYISEPRYVQNLVSQGTMTFDEANQQWTKTIEVNHRSVDLELTLYRWERTYHGRKYRWRAQYEKSTRTFEVVTVPQQTLPVSQQPITPTTGADVMIDQIYSNF